MKGHHSPKKTKKPRLPLYRLYYAVVLLLVAVSGTSMWTTTTLAKYVTSSSGSDSARVARFAVSAAGADNTAINLDAGDAAKKQAEYQFTVSNKIGDKVNETATGYDVVVTFPSELKGVTLTLRNGNNTFSAKPSTDNTTYTFENVGNFPAGTAQTHNLTLTFAVEEGAEGGEWDNIKIEVRAAQKN